MKKRTKCYLYTRVSTSMQVDGYSLDAQRDKLRKYAEYEDMIVAGEYSDEVFSGKNIQGRHEFQRMMQDIQDWISCSLNLKRNWIMAHCLVRLSALWLVMRKNRIFAQKLSRNGKRKILDTKTHGGE